MKRRPTLIIAALLLALSFTARTDALESRSGGPKGDTGTGCATLGGDLSGNCGAAVVNQSTPASGTFTVNGVETLAEVGGFSELNLNTASGGTPWFVAAFPSGNGTGTEFQVAGPSVGSSLNIFDGNDTLLPSVVQIFGPLFFDGAGFPPNFQRTFATLPAPDFDGIVAPVFDAPTNNLGDVLTVGGGSLEALVMTFNSKWVVIGTPRGLTPQVDTLANLGTCTSANEGQHKVQTNSLVACVAGVTAAGGGSTHCEVYCQQQAGPTYVWVRTGL
jgi:hypothetical protein